MNNAAYVLGIDIGTTGARVGIFDLKGNPVVFCSENFPLYTPASGRAEQDANEWWEAVCKASKKAAVVMATKCWAEDGIYAVCISPARTKTKMRKSLYPDEDQNTLLDPDDFAKVVYNAVCHKYPSGTHIVVRKQNVQDILAQAK